jgi:uncharacterized protein
VNAIERTFGRRRVLLPVIHVDSRVTLASRNVEVAREAGASGAFLIGHGMDAADLNAIWYVVSEEHPEFWIGINHLDLRGGGSVAHAPAGARAVWTDDTLLEHPLDGPQRTGDRVAAAARARDILLFSGVAFKHGRRLGKAEEEARAAATFTDVLVTSGVATGREADLTQVEAVRRGAGDRPIALASGVTSENVQMYLPLVDAYLVATGISRDFHTLDPARTRALAEAIHAWSAE